MRIVTALVGIPVFVVLTWLGGWPFAAMVAAIAVLGQREAASMFTAAGLPTEKHVAFVAAGLLALAPVMAWSVMPALLLALVALGTFAFRPADPSTLGGAAGTLFSIVYPAAFLAPLLLIRTMEGGGIDPFLVTLGLVVLMWTADTGAYYAGRTFGRHLLAPTVSPKKTWEGVIGGVVGAAMVGSAIGLWAGTGLALHHWIVLAAIAALVGPCGDLFESALKRAAGVKDSSSILPGHGGLLDRFDALFFVAPTAWVYLVLVAGL